MILIYNSYMNIQYSHAHIVSVWCMFVHDGADGEIRSRVNKHSQPRLEWQNMNVLLRICLLLNLNAHSKALCSGRFMYQKNKQKNPTKNNNPFRSPLQCTSWTHKEPNSIFITVCFPLFSSERRPGGDPFWWMTEWCKTQWQKASWVCRGATNCTMCTVLLAMFEMDATGESTMFLLLCCETVKQTHSVGHKVKS